MAYVPYEKKTFFDKVSGEEGDSNIYVGISYLRIVAEQIRIVRESERMALAYKGDILFLWLNEMRAFRDLIESRTGINTSVKEIDAFKYELENQQLIRKEIKIKEKEKYDVLFREIEKMIERNLGIQQVNSTNKYLDKRYINDKKILEELSSCWRQLMIDANRKHLIMPEGMKDMKELVKSQWIDREEKKEF
jgi:hypothetical protein